MPDEHDPSPRDSRIKEVFARTWELPTTEERQRYLEEACGEDESLRCLVESLLRAHEASGAFLSRDVSGEQLDTLTEEIDSEIGPYRLLERLGEGGFGEVYRAEQTQPVKREIALKIIKPGMDSKEVLARFQGERQALALMDHPNIVRILEAGTTEGGRPYFVMELACGEPITQYCDVRRLPLVKRLELFQRVCAAVHHAHQKGVIHRDLKPSNIVVMLQDGQPVPKIIDFGIAKSLQGRLTDRPISTRRELLLGTPAYMSPEQVTLASEDVDTRTDIYSLGVLLYELIAGATPFESDTLRKAALAEVQRMIRDIEPPKPSTRLHMLGAEATEIARRRAIEPLVLKRAVQGDLDWIVMKAIEKDRGQRYDNAAELAREIERHLNHEPVRVGPPNAAYRARKFIRRHRLGVTTAITLATALALGFVVSLIGFARARSERNRALEAEQRAETEKAISTAVNDFLLKDLLEQASPEQEPDRDVKLRILLDRAAAQVESRFEGQPLVEAQIRETLGSVYQSLGESTNARPHFERAFQLYTENYGSEDLRTLRVRRSILSLMGEPQAGEKLAEALVALQRRTLGPEHPETLKSLQLLGAFYYDQGKLQETEDLIRGVLAVRRRVLGRDHPDTVKAMHNLAEVFRVQGRSAQPEKMAEARKLLEEALDLSRRHPGPEHPDTLVAMLNLGAVYGAQGDTTAAQELFAKALEIQSRVLGPEHNQTLNTMYNLALTEQFQGKYQEARKTYEDLIALRSKMVGPQDEKTAQIKLNLGVVLTAEGELATAGELFDQALNEFQRVSGPKSPAAFRALLGKAQLGQAYLRQGEPAEAQSIFEEVLTGMSATVPSTHPEVLNTRLDLAAAFAAQGRVASADEIYREVIASSVTSQDSLQSTNSGEVLVIQLPAARALRALGRPSEALKFYRNHLATETRELGLGHPSTQETLRSLAETCTEARQLIEAYELLNELLPLQVHSWGPTSPQALDTIGRLTLLSTALGRWSEALEHCRTYAAADTNNFAPARHAAALAKLSGQEQVCREQCTLLLSHAAAMTNDVGAARLAAQTCLATGENGSDLAFVLQLADRAVNLGTTPGDLPPDDPELRLLRGLAEYRAGCPGEAVATLSSLATAADVRGLLACYLMALAYQELNQPQEAGAFLADANHRLEEQLHTGILTGSSDFGRDEVQMCEVLLIREEAERVLLSRQVTTQSENSPEQ